MNKGTMLGLDDFISKVLRDIMRGVEDAQLRVKGTGAKINAPTEAEDDRVLGGKRQVKPVAFDVTIAVEQRTEGDAKVVVPFFEVGGEHAKTHTATSRVQFEIPVTYPPSPD